MDKIRSLRLKTLLTATLTVILALSLVFTAACSTDSASSTSDSSSSSNSSSDASDTTRTDYQVITNGDFEYKIDNATSFPVTSNMGWTREYDSIIDAAVSSTKDSGIISVAEGNDYDDFAKKNGLPESYNPQTPEKLGYLSDGDLYVYDKDVTNDRKIPTSGDHILMIHNHTSDESGTAQKFRSSATVTVDGYGKLSAWVRTKDLKSQIEGVEYGAYISLETTVGSTKTPFIIEGIDTNDEWQKFEIYVDASYFATTTFKVVLGLGFGSRKVKTDYVEGFAFFDNIHYEDVSAEDYIAAVGAIAETDKFCAFAEKESVDTCFYTNTDDDGDHFTDTTVYVPAEAEAGDLKVKYSERTSSVNEKGYKQYAVAFSNRIETYNYNVADKFTASENDVFKSGDIEYKMNTALGVGAFDSLSGEDYAQIEGVTNPVAANAETVYLIHNDGYVVESGEETSVPYGASSKIVIEDDGFVVCDGAAAYITFLMKVKTGTNQSGVTFKIIDKGSKKTACEKATAVLTSVNTNDADEDEQNGFVRANVFVSNFNGDKFERYFAIEIDFGPTEKIVQDAIKLTKGYALITGIEQNLISKETYDEATKSGTYSGSVSLGAEINNSSADDDDDEVYSINYATSGKSAIRSNVVTSIIDYTGALGGSKAVGGEADNVAGENVVAGVINTKYADNYAALAEVVGDVKALKADDGKNVQPLVIYNKEAASYGFIGSARTLSANSSELVSVKLRVFGDAKAYVYLASTDALNNFNVLAIEGKKVNRDGKKPVYSTAKEDAEVYEELYLAIDSADCDGDWLTVSFFVTSGENKIPYRVEVFNGTRDGAESGLSQGLLAVESISYSTDKTADQFREETISLFGESDKDVVKSYAGAVKTVTYTDTDGFNNVKYTSDPSAKDVYVYLDNAKAVIASYGNIDVKLEADETTETKEPDSSEETDDEKEANYSLPLQITSIVISAVLIVVLLVLVFRALFKKVKQEPAAESYYNRNSREKTQDLINRNKAKREAAAKKKAEEGAALPEEENEPDATESEEEHEAEKTETENEPSAEETPYDYDNPENNVPKDE